MWPILVQRDPNLLIRIPPPHPSHKPTDLLGVLGLGEGPPGPTVVGLVKEVDRDWLDIEEQ
jgi:hypothetical protein